MIEESLSKPIFNDPKINSMFSYATGGGQRIRPKILLLSCEAVGGNPEKALPAALAVELMHKFTLIHDDIVDNDEFRRGKPTFYKKYGTNYAIFMGDFICSEAFDQLKAIAERDFEIGYSCYKMLSDTFYKLCLGEVLDTMPCKFMTKEEYLNLVYLKSAVVIETAGRMGTLLGGGSWGEQQMLAGFGKNFAIAMQILNDIKDTMGTERRKLDRNSSDIWESKWNILLINAFERAHYHNKRELLRIMNAEEKSDKDITSVQKIIRECKSEAYARELAKFYFKKARKEINGLNPSKAKESLLALSDIGVDEGYWKAK